MNTGTQEGERTHEANHAYTQKDPLTKWHHVRTVDSLFKAPVSYEKNEFRPKLIKAPL